MATVKIGDRELEVPAMLMGASRKVLRPARAAFLAALIAADEGPKGDEWDDAVTAAVAAYLLAYGLSVELDWLVDNLPQPRLQFELLKAVRRAAGFLESPPGEAASP